MKNLDISCYIGSDDYRLFESIVNQGIDARLEAFTKSNFKVDEDEKRLYMDIDTSELSVFMRRLSKVAEDDSNADLWEDDILDLYFDIELS